jgi:hypothetical protein
MKKLLVCLLLAGCSTTVPVKRNFPDVPQVLKTPCPELKEVQEGTVRLSDVLSVVTDNYSQYHECKITVEAWIEWYDQQKKIFEEVK